MILGTAYYCCQRDPRRYRSVCRRRKSSWFSSWWAPIWCLWC